MLLQRCETPLNRGVDARPPFTGERIEFGCRQGFRGLMLSRLTDVIPFRFARKQRTRLPFTSRCPMAKLVTGSRFADPDAAYVALDTKLVLILANHIGDLDVLNEAIALAREPAGSSP